MNYRVATALFGILVLHSGCATLVHRGASEDLTIKSEPVGATVVLDGVERGVTPLQVTVERNEPHTVVLSMDGFKEATRKIESNLSWWVAGNAASGGIGLVVDLLSGNGYTIDPGELDVTLESTTERKDILFGSLIDSAWTALP